MFSAGRGDYVMAIFSNNKGVKVIRAGAEDLFLGKLAEVDDPEAKRKVICNTFIEMFDAKASKLTHAKWLEPGTIYLDVIESAGSKTDTARVIKSHRNVHGLCRVVRTAQDPDRLHPTRQAQPKCVR